MEEIKTLGFDWKYGHEELALQVASYLNNGSLYIGIFNKTDEGFEQFGDLTVNLPMNSMILPETSEAYISDFSSKEKLEFIKKHRLGVVLPETGKSGYCTYAKVAFDLKRLRELDPIGTERYLQSRKDQELPKKGAKPAKRKYEEKER